jgi:hypothetical protein
VGVVIQDTPDPKLFKVISDHLKNVCISKVILILPKMRKSPKLSFALINFGQFSSVLGEFCPIFSSKTRQNRKKSFLKNAILF